jgi:hypothetical protein
MRIAPIPAAPVFAALALAGCGIVRPAHEVVLRWPAAAVPEAATDLHYEVAIWERQRGVPTARVAHHERVTATTLTIATARAPQDVCWSVRAHWLQAGEPRQSTWLTAGDESRIGSHGTARRARDVARGPLAWIATDALGRAGGLPDAAPLPPRVARHR